jgi:4-hydroxyphenylpyruvate dioxygenase
MKILNQGFDHVEFIVRSIDQHRSMYEKMGFEKIGERKIPGRGTRSVVYAQGFVRIVLTECDASPAAENQECVRFLRAHDEGICVLAIEVDDATKAFEETTARGARPARKPERFDSPEGSVVRAEIWTPGDVRYAFIERKAARGNSNPALFDEQLVVSRLESPSPLGIKMIDHLTNNVPIGDGKKWSQWYEQVFGFIITRHFDISTGRTGLASDVVQSPDFKIKVPVNEATEPESQVQEFVDRLKGAGVQHLALLTTGIIPTVGGLRSQGFKFLTVPHSYYEVVPTRVPGVTEDLAELEKLGILLDGESGDGYLLQIFSGEMVGPFFFEFIQRKGDKGFGEGNFRALFEAMERDQVMRGVLPPKKSGSGSGQAATA